MPVVAYALLIELARGPATGYDLAARMRGTVAYFWTAPHSQIYPQLGLLAEAGLVTWSEAPGPGPRPKRTYAVTAAGRRALAAWLAEPVTHRSVRDELVLKAYAAPAADPAALAEVFWDEAVRQRAQLAEYESFEAELRQERGADLDDPSSPWFGNLSALALGLATARFRLEWCEWMIERLSGPRTSAVAPR